jgi:ribonuclease T2
MLFARNPPLALALLLFGLLAPGWAASAELAEGSFLAVKDCPAWVSKAQQTNPDDVRLVPGRIYPYMEVNIKEAPDAFRLIIKGANPERRWVLGECGESPPKSNPKTVAANFAAARLAAEGFSQANACPTPPPSKDPCRACGKTVYSVLALAWLPGKCEALKDKPERPPECDSLDANAYGARNLTLGEMRPALGKCRKTAGYCGSVDKEATPHTAYPEVALSEPNQKALALVMPGMLLNTGEERHQWFKHGTCSGLTENSYFTLLADLTQRINQSGVGDFLVQARGAKVKREDVFKKLDELLGKNARKHINLQCGKDGKALTEVLVTLPAKLPPGTDIGDLIAKAPGAGSAGNCASKFLIPTVTE